MRQDGSGAHSRAPSIARKLIFWEFARASWQYDLVVALILIFIFATPREWFRDQPRANSVTLISSNRGYDQIFLEAVLLESVPPAERASRAAELIRHKTGKQLKILKIEAIRDEPDAEVKGFIAYTSHQN
jgi:hypothetical protein